MYIPAGGRGALLKQGHQVSLGEWTKHNPAPARWVVPVL